jgi:hypothetical protein
VIALGACGSEPDSVVTVRRLGTDRVSVQLCEDMTGAACPQNDDLFAIGEASTAEHTIGIYLDSPATSLALLFTTFLASEVNLCHYVIVPFTGARDDLTVTLPVTLADPDVDGCDDCDVGTCTQ